MSLLPILHDVLVTNIVQTGNNWSQKGGHGRGRPYRVRGYARSCYFLNQAGHGQFFLSRWKRQS